MTWLAAAAELTAPVTVAQFELSDSAIDVPAASYSADDPDAAGLAADASKALVLVRLHGRPLGTILVGAPGGRIDQQACAALARESLGLQITAHLDADGAVPGLAREQPGGPAVPVSVVVATRERPALLAACLDSLARLDYPDYEVVVVDNAPVTDRTAALILRRADSRVRYVTETRRGLAAAHNRGLTAARGSVVAFTDDDVLADRDWLTQVTAAMRSAPGVACVTGLIMPAELMTQSQLMLELHGHFGKGYERRVLNARERRPDDPLFPFTVGKLGSGANMSFRRDVLRAIGGFDPATGVGTLARGGDDLAALFAVLAGGHSIAYEPGALVWHRHRRDPDSLTGQAYGYGVGLGAYLSSALARHPRMIAHALVRAPAGLAYAIRSDSPRHAHLNGSWPRELVRLERRGLAYGPLAYALSRWRTRGTSIPRGDA